MRKPVDDIMYFNRFSNLANKYGDDFRNAVLNYIQDCFDEKFPDVFLTYNHANLNLPSEIKLINLNINKQEFLFMIMIEKKQKSRLSRIFKPELEYSKNFVEICKHLNDNLICDLDYHVSFQPMLTDDKMFYIFYKYESPMRVCLNAERKQKEEEELKLLMNPYNAIGSEETELMVEDTLRKLKDSIAMTLGPYAKTTIVEDLGKKHSITKDGYTVLRSLCFENELSRTIFEIVLKVSKTLVRKVGDGSTSSIVIAYYLYENIKDMIRENKITSKDIMDIMADYAKLIEEHVRFCASEVSPDMKELEYIASVSCNNDTKYGALIKEIFQKVGRYGFINLEKSLTDRTYYELKNGYELNRGYISTLMANQADKKNVILKEPKVLMVEGMITEEDLTPLADLLGKYCAQIGGSMVIIASGYSNEAQTFFHMNRLNAKRNNNESLFSVVAIDIATKDADDKDRFEDLAINLGCSPIRVMDGDLLTNYTADLLLTKCGSCKEFKGDEFNSKLIEGQGKPELKEARIKEITEKLATIERNEYATLHDIQVYEMRKRMALLQNSMATLYIGGSSEQEKETDKFLLEDAVLACKSALKNGYVYGGNLVIPMYLHSESLKTDLVEKLEPNYKHIKPSYLMDILNAINNAFLESFKSVLRNYYVNNETEIDDIITTCLTGGYIYNLKLHEYEDKETTKIINSCQTDIEILNTVISIIGLVATSNQFIGLNIKK